MPWLLAGFINRNGFRTQEVLPALGCTPAAATLTLAGLSIRNSRRVTITWKKYTGRLSERKSSRTAGTGTTSCVKARQGRSFATSAIDSEIEAVFEHQRGTCSNPRPNHSGSQRGHNLRHGCGRDARWTRSMSRPSFLGVDELLPASNYKPINGGVWEQFGNIRRRSRESQHDLRWG